MLKLKGQTESGEWVEFDISQVYDVCLYDNRWYIKEYHNEIPINCVTYIIDPATIQLADDPRKNILKDESIVTAGASQDLRRYKVEGIDKNGAATKLITQAYNYARWYNESQIKKFRIAKKEAKL